MSIYRLTVNGRPHDVSVDYDDTPLLYVLRDDLGLKGTRFGCGTGHCGACAVLVDGRAQRSCELPIWAVEKQSITTIEGLGTPDHLHPLQEALVEFQAGQCGYCLNGIIMTAAELIASGGPSSRDRIAAGLEDNLCRCGAHGRIVSAIEALWKRSSENG